MATVPSPQLIVARKSLGLPTSAGGWSVNLDEATTTLLSGTPATAGIVAAVPVSASFELMMWTFSIAE